MTDSSLVQGTTFTTGSFLSAFVMFPEANKHEEEFVVNVRIGTSFISEDQARRNIDLEIPDAPKSRSK
jgi:putative alpha-1,2-mannosidase